LEAAVFWFLEYRPFSFSPFVLPLVAVPLKKGQPLLQPLGRFSVPASPKRFHGSCFFPSSSKFVMRLFGLWAGPRFYCFLLVVDFPLDSAGRFLAASKHASTPVSVAFRTNSSPVAVIPLSA